MPCRTPTSLWYLSITAVTPMAVSRSLGNEDDLAYLHPSPDASRVCANRRGEPPARCLGCRPSCWQREGNVSPCAIGYHLFELIW